MFLDESKYFCVLLYHMHRTEIQHTDEYCLVLSVTYSSRELLFARLTYSIVFIYNVFQLHSEKNKWIVNNTFCFSVCIHRTLVECGLRLAGSQCDRVLTRGTLSRNFVRFQWNYVSNGFLVRWAHLRCHFFNGSLVQTNKVGRFVMNLPNFALERPQAFLKK